MLPESVAAERRELDLCPSRSGLSPRSGAAIGDGNRSRRVLTSGPMGELQCCGALEVDGDGAQRPQQVHELGDRHTVSVCSCR